MFGPISICKANNDNKYKQMYRHTDLKEISLRDLREYVDTGDIEAIYELGNRYLVGKDVRKNQPKAFRLYMEAAERNSSPWGHGFIYEAIGDCQYYGLGIHEDEIAAFKSYQKGSERGYAKSTYSVAICYMHGLGVRQDLTVAINYLEKAARSNLPQAEYTLGDLLLEEGRFHDDKRGEELITRAAYQGYAPAQERKARYITECATERDHVPNLEDIYCLAYAWLNLASAGSAEYARYRDTFLKRGQDFLLRGQRLSREIELKIKCRQIIRPLPSPADLLGLVSED